MPIRVLLRNSAWAQEDIERLTKAFERTLRTVGIQDRNDVLSELIAKKVIEIGQTGSKDPDLICARAIEELGLP